MLDSTTVMERPTSFQFKTSFSPCIIMKLSRSNLDDLAHEVPATVSRAPNFFMGSPVVLDLESLNSTDLVNFKELKHLLIQNNLIPVGVRGGNEEQHSAAVTAGIPLITIGSGKTKTNSPEQTSDAPEARKETSQQTVSMQKAKLITTPIRSGMQVYAKDTDLIVVAPVSPGAELLADGNIHVYGPLRGRALAGVQGNVQARIFCRTLEAELVAIAGYYLVKEDMQSAIAQDSMVQIYLQGEDVKISTI